MPAAVRAVRQSLGAMCPVLWQQHEVNGGQARQHDVQGLGLAGQLALSAPALSRWEDEAMRILQGSAGSFEHFPVQRNVADLPATC